MTEEIESCAPCTRVICVANEKGGSGKSTVAINIAIALLRSGQSVATIDLDGRQRSFTHYVDNRLAWARQRGKALPSPTHVCLDDEAEFSTAQDETAGRAAFGHDAFEFDGLPAPAVKAKDPIGLRDRVPALDIGELATMDLAGSDMPVIEIAPQRRARPVTVAVARNAHTFFIAGHRNSPVTRACKCRVELAADQLFDEPARRARTSVSIGSNQLSKRSTAISAAGCKKSGFVVMLVMAWSPVRRFNAG